MPFPSLPSVTGSAGVCLLQGCLRGSVTLEQETRDAGQCALQLTPLPPTFLNVFTLGFQEGGEGQF